jgi:hypothetical protein
VRVCYPMPSLQTETHLVKSPSRQQVWLDSATIPARRTVASRNADLHYQIALVNDRFLQREGVNVSPVAPPLRLLSGRKWLRDCNRLTSEVYDPSRPSAHDGTPARESIAQSDQRYNLYIPPLFPFTFLRILGTRYASELSPVTYAREGVQYSSVALRFTFSSYRVW